MSAEYDKYCIEFDKLYNKIVSRPKSKHCNCLDQIESLHVAFVEEITRWIGEFMTRF